MSGKRQSLFKEVKNGRFKIWQEPIPGAYYSIGADVAEGLELGDSSTAVIVDSNQNHVATWGGKIDPYEFGETLCRIGEKYNNALICSELNNHGHSTLAAIKNRGYGNIYQREVTDERGVKIRDKVMWLNTKTEKLKALNNLVREFNENRFLPQDVALLKEMSKLTIESDGNVCLNGKDLVVAAMLALEGLTQVVTRDLKAFHPGDTKKTGDIMTLSREERLKRYSRQKGYDSFS